MKCKYCNLKIIAQNETPQFETFWIHENSREMRCYLYAEPVDVRGPSGCGRVMQDIDRVPDQQNGDQ